jgi:hypothetical protein
MPNKYFTSLDAQIARHKQGLLYIKDVAIGNHLFFDSEDGLEELIVTEISEHEISVNVISSGAHEVIRSDEATIWFNLFKEDPRR